MIRFIMILFVLYSTGCGNQDIQNKNNQTQSSIADYTKDIQSSDIIINNGILEFTTNKTIDNIQTTLIMYDVNNLLYKQASLLNNTFIIKNIDTGTYIIKIHLVDIYNNTKEFSFISVVE